MIFFIHSCIPICIFWNFCKSLWIMILGNLSQKRRGSLKLRTCSALISRITSKITSYFTCWTGPSRKYWCWYNWRNVSRKRWIFILTVIIINWSWKPVKEVGSRRRQNHWIGLTGQRWHTHQVRLAGQDIFINFNISSNDYIMRCGWRSLYPFTSSEYPTNMHFSLLGCNAFRFSSRMWAHASQPNTWKWLTSGLILLHDSFGVIPCKI